MREHRRLYATSGISGMEGLSYLGQKAELSERLYMTAKEICGLVQARFLVA